MYYQVETNGQVVWVNSSEILLGRFSKRGIDVHVKGTCIDGSCSSGPCGLKEWVRFKRLMVKHHDIEVPDKYMPDYLKEETK